MEASTNSDGFGFAIGGYGDILVIGVPGRSVAQIYQRQAGGAFVFNSQLNYYTDATSNFGNSVLVDSEFIYVGAPGDTTIQIYSITGLAFYQKIQSTNLTERYGTSFSSFLLEGFDIWLVTGAPGGVGYVELRLHTPFTMAFIFFNKLVSNNTLVVGLGQSVAITFLGTVRIVIGGAPESYGPFPSYSPSVGAAIVFVDEVETQTLLSPNPAAYNRFGTSLSVSGNALLIGESNGNLMHLFYISNSTGQIEITYNYTLTNATSFPVGSAISYDYGLVVNGRGNYFSAGVTLTVPVYNVTVNTTVPITTCQSTLRGLDTAAQDNFGASLQILSPDNGNTLIAAIGSPNAISDFEGNATDMIRGGSVYLFCINADGTSCTNCTNGYINRCGVCNGTVNCTAPTLTTGTVPTTGVPPLTTGRVTTGQFTTGQATTVRSTTGRATTGSPTTTTTYTTSVPYTTGQFTTGAVTTGSLTTGQQTTGAVTTGRSTTGQLVTTSTHAVTTSFYHPPTTSAPIVIINTKPNNFTFMLIGLFSGFVLLIISVAVMKPWVFNYSAVTEEVGRYRGDNGLRYAYRDNYNDDNDGIYESDEDP